MRSGRPAEHEPEPFKPGPRGLVHRLRSRRRSAPVPPVPFIVGATRSGTTLLRLMLDAHSELALPSETHFIPDLLEACQARDATPEALTELLVAQRRWGDFQLDAGELRDRFHRVDRLTGPAAIRAFYKLYADGQGKPRWGDKTPGYIRKMRAIDAELPEARFVHLIRDGRDVALSVLKMPWGPKTIEAAAERWRDRIERGRIHSRFIGHYLEVHFEDLILDTEGQLRRICEFSEIEFDPAMLTYYERAGERLAEKARALPAGGAGAQQSAEARLESHAKTLEPPRPEMVGGWRTRMAPDDQVRFERIAGDLLDELGYETSERRDGEVHRPGQRRLRLPGLVRTNLTKVAQATGLSEPAERRLPAPFLVGMTRSGVELLAEMMRAHPDLVIPPETHFVPGLAETIRSEPVTVERVVGLISASRPLSDYGINEILLAERLEELEEVKAAAVTRAFYALVAEQAKVSRWGDATGAYLQRIRRVQRVLKEAHFIHVVRDGRDIVASRPAGVETGKTMVMAQKWVKRVGDSLEDADRVENYLQVRYEDLIADPERVLRQICEYCELSFDSRMLAPARRAETEARMGPIGDWRVKLDPADVAAFEDVAGDLLGDLGYELASTASSG